MPAFLSATTACFAALGLTSLLSIRSAPAPDTQLPGRVPGGAAAEVLATGKLLIAARRLPDPNFANVVILLVDFSRTGAAGLVVNRRSEVTLARVFPHLVPTPTTASHAFLGGPVGRTVATALVRTPDPPAGARHVFDGVHFVASREALDALLASSAAPDRARVYLGYAGWGPGQLEEETRQGVWHVLDADVDAVFAEDPGSTWQREIVRTEVIQARRSPPFTTARAAD
jgi:putative transcriptional regulator